MALDERLFSGPKPKEGGVPLRLGNLMEMGNLFLREVSSGDLFHPRKRLFPFDIHSHAAAHCERPKHPIPGVAQIEIHATGIE